MSLVPCDRHGDLRPGRVSGTYPTVVRDGARYTRRLRLCEECLEELLEDRKEEWIDVTVSSRGETPRQCGKCKQEADQYADLSTFWFTCYIQGKYRRDYKSLYCSECAQVMIDSLALEVTDGRR